MFGPGGIWARFLARSAGYIVTDMKGESLDDGQYRVRDFWHGHRGFEGFREHYSEDFAQFDRQIVDGLIERQEFVGAYYEADGKI